MFYNTGIGTYVWVVTNRKSKARQGKIQLIDGRDRWAPMRRSLGDKRRYLTDEIITALTREHGAFKPADTCKLFDNQDFGYRRITIERPLRLRFQITEEAKETFLDACPEFLDAMQGVEQVFGSDAEDDWNDVWPKVKITAEECGAEWTTPNKKLFRTVFTKTEPSAKPVIARRGSFTGIVGPGAFPGQQLVGDLEPSELDNIFGIYPETRGKKGKALQYEPDPDLRDFENVPLKETIVSFFLREVRPFVSDAWIDAETKDEKDGGIGKVGYEISFNREFFHYEQPRPLQVIDSELAAVEKRIIGMLKEVTQ
jgi:type I restriction enzyme M protein